MRSVTLALGIIAGMVLAIILSGCRSAGDAGRPRVEIEDSPHCTVTVTVHQSGRHTLEAGKDTAVDALRGLGQGSNIALQGTAEGTPTATQGGDTTVGGADNTE